MKNYFKKTWMLLLLMMVSMGAWARVQTGNTTLFAFDSKEAIVAWGYKAPTSTNSYTLLDRDVTFVKSGITIQANKGDGTDTRFSYDKGNYELRIYDGGSIVITAPNDYNIVSVQFSGNAVEFSCDGYDNTTHLWTGESSSVTFNATSSSTTIKVSRIEVTIDDASIVPTTATISINAACTDGEKFYGTYSNASAWVVPGNLTVSAISVSGEALTMVDYATGDVVPANTGVLVAASEGGNFTVNLSSGAGTTKPGNALRPTGDGITASEMATADPGKEYFRLTMHNGIQCGFWWGAVNGASFDLGANKAYLVADPSSAGARGFSFGDNTEALESIEMSAATTIYTINGVKVNELQKGLNIVNGKKVMVK